MSNTHPSHYFSRIQGWFHAPLTYLKMVAEAPNGAQFAEVGVWKGQSAAFMGVEIMKARKDITLHLVDLWTGFDHPEDPVAREGRLYDEFLANIEPVKDVVKIHRGHSSKMASLFHDETFEFVYIDASHDYESCRADIEAWLPKVKRGGVMAGDDFCRHSPGVIQAVVELLPGFTSPEHMVWFWRKP